MRQSSVYGLDDYSLLTLVIARPYWEDAYAEDKECLIEGGKHAPFGDYGEQKGDGAARFSAQEQQRQAVRLIWDSIVPAE